VEVQEEYSNTMTLLPHRVRPRVLPAVLAVGATILTVGAAGAVDWSAAKALTVDMILHRPDKAGAPLVAEFRFSEPVKGFAIDDLSAINATFGKKLTGAGANFTIKVKPIKSGMVTITLQRDSVKAKNSTAANPPAGPASEVSASASSEPVEEMPSLKELNEMIGGGAPIHGESLKGKNLAEKRRKETEDKAELSSMTDLDDGEPMKRRKTFLPLSD
jgi:hypothetical protein